MKRHQFMLDLLRPGITVQEISEWIGNKRELTNDDLDQIILHAVRVAEAASLARSTGMRSQD
jgi:hypothetical protein